MSEEIRKAASVVNRSERTIRRWMAQGIDIRNERKLKTFADEVSARAFGRSGNGARLMGKRGGSRTSEAKKQSSKLNGKRRHKDGLLLLKKAIRNGNHLDLRNTSDEDLKAIWRALVEINKWHLFWIGDTLNKISKEHGESSARVAARQSPEPISFWDAAKKSRELPPRNRNSLTFRMHLTALDEAGNAGAATWLKIAEEQKWNPPTLRAAIRSALAEHPRSSRIKGTRTITFDLSQLSRSVKKITAERPINEWSELEVCAFLDDAVTVAETIESAKERWLYFNGSIPAVPE
jgi:hypothetical protein